MRYISGNGQARGDNVIAMPRVRGGVSLSPLRQAEAYWLALSGNAGVPLRSRIDPRGLANILDNTFILERVAPRVARFRLAGAHLEDLAGMDVRGIPFSALFSDAARSEAGTLLERVFSGPSVAEIRLEHPAAAGRPAGEGRMILLPLATDAGEITRALGVIVADPDCGRLPCRFDIAGRLLRPVPSADAPRAAARPVATDQMATAPAPARPIEVAGFAEPSAEFAGLSGHLRLVK